MFPDVGIFNWLLLGVQTMALVVLALYALETYRLRRVTEVQVRQATLPVLEINELDTGYRLKNVGLGIAASILLPRLSLRDSAGNKMNCKFNPLYMLVAGIGADIEHVIEIRPANENRVIEKSPQIIKDVIRMAMGRESSFELPLYVTDIAGREYRCMIIWSYARDPASLVLGDAPVPRVGPPQILRDQIKDPSTLEVSIQTSSLNGFM